MIKKTAAKHIRAADERGVSLVEVIPSEEREAVLREAEEMVVAEAGETEAPDNAINLKLTPIEGAKGLSAQHVFLVGLHAGELPRNPDAIQDIEICKFLVGLTRTKKKCTLLITRNFAGNRKSPSPFLDWIDGARYEQVTVDATYWKSGRN